MRARAGGCRSSLLNACTSSACHDIQQRDAEPPSLLPAGTTDWIQLNIWDPALGAEAEHALKKGDLVVAQVGRVDVWKNAVIALSLLCSFEPALYATAAQRTLCACCARRGWQRCRQVAAQLVTQRCCRPVAGCLRSSSAATVVKLLPKLPLKALTSVDLALQRFLQPQCAATSGKQGTARI